eukprot:TRINITY_DN942_c2_g1_i1.p1 TRINITY_DN942_c2_g1~~TRINITY_DN942_c2_g1_i1.p1  ORF type:complete len:359 (+),score=58.69 TRINITY_DN942_c2_g1_i1:131-1078(+)
MRATRYPSRSPTLQPSSSPSAEPTPAPSAEPTAEPTADPTSDPTEDPTSRPTKRPTLTPTAKPTRSPTNQTSKPTRTPTPDPTQATKSPTPDPTKSPTRTDEPTWVPTPEPTLNTSSPTSTPTPGPTSTNTTTTTTTSTRTVTTVVTPEMYVSGSLELTPPESLASMFVDGGDAQEELRELLATILGMNGTDNIDVHFKPEEPEPEPDFENSGVLAETSRVALLRRASGEGAAATQSRREHERVARDLPESETVTALFKARCESAVQAAGLAAVFRGMDKNTLDQELRFRFAIIDSSILMPGTPDILGSFTATSR